MSENSDDAHVYTSPAIRTGDFSIAGRLKSFRFAASGIHFMLKSQHNAWVHLGITVVVTLVGLLFGLTASDWRWVIAAVAFVWLGETMNTAFEFLCDVVAPEFHGSVEKAKDIAAGAVLICAGAAAMIGVLTFWPYFFKAF